MTGGRVRLEIRTAMAEALLDRAAEAGVRLSGVERSGPHALTVWTPSADEERLTVLLSQYSVPFRVTGRAGLARGQAFVRRRLALCAALLLAGLALIWISSRIWVISIKGAAPAEEARIRAALAENGAAVGCSRRGLDYMALRLALEAEMPQYVFFGVKTLGVTLEVQAVQADAAPEVYRIAAARDLVADADGVVLSVHAAAGQALVKPGDTVKRGDVLIRGQERTSVSGETKAVRAEGSVTARLWTEGAARLPLTRCETRLTGRRAAESRLETPFFSRVLAGGAPFAEAAEESEVCPVVGLFVPVRVVRRVFLETESALVSEDPAALRAAAAALAKAKARSIAPAGAEESRSWTEYQMDGAYLTARAVVEWTKEIARGAQGG